MAGKVKIKDVALAANVSVGTVSHYLNGRFVSEERSRRIKQAIDDLGFVSNLLAKGMRQQKSPVIGISLPYAGVANFSSLVDALDTIVSDADYELMQVLSRHDPEKEFHRIKRLVAFQVGGVLLIPSPDAEPMLDYLHKNSVPTVILNRSLKDENRFDQISVDHDSAAAEATRRLLARGHRRFALLARFPSLWTTRSRMGAIEQELAAFGVGASAVLHQCSNDKAEFDASFGALMATKDRPTAILISNETIAVWALEALRNNAIACPQTVAAVCLSMPSWAQLLTPRIAYVEQPTVELAELAWKTLSERMANPGGAARRMLLPARLIMPEDEPAHTQVETNSTGA